MAWQVDRHKWTTLKTMAFLTQDWIESLFAFRVVIPEPPRPPSHPGGNPGANLKSIFHSCYLREEAFECELTKETIDLPLGHLQGGLARRCSDAWLRS